MRIRDIYRRAQFGLSIEIFPPKTPAGDETLRQALKRLAAYRPAFFSCTYGAGGSTRQRTVEWCVEIQQDLGIPATSHFTCVGSTVEELREWLRLAGSEGIQNIMALRGDPPQGDEDFQAVDGGLQHANELVEVIHREFPQMGVAVAGYPEKHHEAPSMEVDLENLRRKVRCGADVVITQLFYINDDFYRFRQRCGQLGIDVPIVPGLLPVTNLSQINRITTLCAATLPTDFVNELGKHDDPDWQSKVGIEFAIRQVRDLLSQGVAGLHFYVLNKSEATSHVVAAVNLPVSVTS